MFARTGLIAAFCIAVPAAASGVAPDIVVFFKDADAVAEVTVVGAKLHTFRAHGEERVCGQSYEVAVNDTVTGDTGSRELLGQRLWEDDETHLRDVANGGLEVGAVYLIAIKRGAGPGDAANLPRALKADSQAPEAAQCLAGVPQDGLASSLRVYRADSTFPNGMPADKREYLKIFSTRSLDFSAIFGALYERYYAKSDTVDPGARGYLADDGVHSATDAIRAYAANAYMKDEGRNGQHANYQVTVSYDAFKRFIRDPKYKPVYRMN